jgi:hypothetical protein
MAVPTPVTALYNNGKAFVATWSGTTLSAAAADAISVVVIGTCA